MARIKEKLIRLILYLLVATVVISTNPYIVSAEDAVILKTVNSRQVLDMGGAVTVFYGKTVAQLIYEETTAHYINPRLILTILQRESSAITQSEPSSETRRAWPMFYNYDERMGTCLNQKDPNYCADIKYNNPTYRERADDYGGVGHQLAYSIANFQRLYNLYDPARPGHDPRFNYNNTKSVYQDGVGLVNINPANIATRVLYDYTPHIEAYNTSSSFYQRFQEWWGATPNGGGYDSANIISDTNFLNNYPMSAQEIDNWLKSKGSWLASDKLSTIPEYVSVPYPAVPGNDDATPQPVPGDFTGDRVVDILDLSTFASFWGQTNPGNNLVDINSDNIVDIIDLSTFAFYWNG